AGSTARGAGGGNGWGGVGADMLYLLQDSAGVVSVVTGGDASLVFDPVAGGGYQARFFRQEALSYSSGTAEFTLTDTTGKVLKFCDFSTGLPAAQRGAFKSFAHPKGNTPSVTSRGSDGQPTEVQRSATVGGTTTTESFQYSYLAAPDPNAGKLSGAVLRRQVNGGAWTTIRQVAYTYYNGTESYGPLGA